MSNKPKNKKKESQSSKHVSATKREQQNRREFTGILLILVAIFAFLCCLPTDAFLLAPAAALIGGLFGQLGRYILPVILIAIAITLFRGKDKPVKLRVFSMLTLIITLSGIAHLCYEIFTGNNTELSLKALWNGGLDWTSGGLVPGFFAEVFEAAITKFGGLIVFLILLILQGMSIFGITINSLITAIKNRPPMPKEESPAPVPKADPAERLVNHVQTKRIERYERKHPVNAAEYDLPIDEPPEEKGKKSKKNRKPDGEQPVEEKPMPVIDAERKQVTIDEIELLPEVTKPTTPITPEPEKVKKGEAAAEAAEISHEIEMKAEETQPEYRFPPISLLDLRRQNTVDATGEMRENTKRLADALESFGIVPNIVDVIRGPSVTRYELELDRGVKLSKVTNLADDIALALGATGVHISAIPDKISVVGIEVPNKSVNVVYAREVIDSPAFKNSKSKISFAVGKDISGNCIVGDISKLPHMLIAGTTGSGKSVCMNTLILSLLNKAMPDEVKLIMVDPKMVELGVYNGIPHLLIPVVTDPKKAAGALQWTVTEMMRRYRMMSEAGVRDIESYNKTIVSDPDQQSMPQIVVVIDELADLMLVAAKEVEESICRIAQMGRASGIHLVIATQRPSADVITGLMKANIPSRIAFAVSSAMESRIILDTQGAEKLVGKGDMLFAPLGQGKPKRIQGCFITDEEVQAVVSSIKAESQSNYSADIIEQIEKRAEQTGKSGSSADASRNSDDNDFDEMLPAAVEVVLETGQASTSMLQRRLKLGYARAARIMDEMAERGIVGGFEGAKPRQILITKEQWEQMQNGTYDPNPPVEDEIP